MSICSIYMHAQNYDIILPFWNKSFLKYYAYTYRSTDATYDFNSPLLKFYQYIDYSKIMNFVMTLLFYIQCTLIIFTLSFICFMFSLVSLYSQVFLCFKNVHLLYEISQAIFVFWGLGAFPSTLTWNVTFFASSIIKYTVQYT